MPINAHLNNSVSSHVMVDVVTHSRVMLRPRGWHCLPLSLCGKFTDHQHLCSWHHGQPHQSRPYWSQDFITTNSTKSKNTNLISHSSSLLEQQSLGTPLPRASSDRHALSLCRIYAKWTDHPQSQWPKSSKAVSYVKFSLVLTKTTLAYVSTINQALKQRSGLR